MTDRPFPPYAPSDPYAPQAYAYAPHATLVAPGDAERIRLELLDHEASIRSFGTLHLFVGWCAVFASVAMILGGIAAMFGSGVYTEDVARLGGAFFVGVGVFYAGYAWLMIHVGRGLRALDSKVLTITTIVAVIGLLFVPVGTLVSAYLLYLLHSAEGKRIFAPEYRAVVAQTPHLHCRTPLWVWFLVVGLTVLLILVLVMVVLKG